MGARGKGTGCLQGSEGPREGASKIPQEGNVVELRGACSGDRKKDDLIRDDLGTV